MDGKDVYSESNRYHRWIRDYSAPHVGPGGCEAARLAYVLGHAWDGVLKKLPDRSRSGSLVSFDKTPKTS